MDLATVDELLTTTRSVRKRLDLTRPVPLDLVRTCIAIAMQSPTGSNSQGWHFVVVTDPEKRTAIAKTYRDAFELYLANPALRPTYAAEDARANQMQRILESSMYLAGHLHEVPVLVIPCIEGRVEQSGVIGQASLYGSILPAAWSFMLAARARGLGAAWTTLHLLGEKDVAAVLGIPETVTQAALLPVAWFTGTDFKPARRLDPDQAIHWNTWDTRASPP